MRVKHIILNAMLTLVFLSSCSHMAVHPRAPDIRMDEPPDIPETIRESKRKDAPRRARPESPTRRKLETLVIPSIEFREASITDVIQYLHEQSIILDKASPPETRGVNIILNLRRPDSPEQSNTDNETRSPAPERDAPRLTLHLRNITLLDAIRYVTEVSGLTFRVDANAVIISEPGVETGEIITRTYRVKPGVIDTLID